MESFLQTEDWLMFQKLLGRPVWHFNDGIMHANVIKHDLPFGQSYLYVPHGPSVDFSKLLGGFRNEARQVVEYLKNIARQEHAMFIKIEPLHDTVPEFLFASGARLKKSSKALQPHRTVIIDLANKSEDELLGGMHHKTRYNIQLAQKKDLQFRQENDADVFWRLLQKTTARDRFSSHQKSYYQKLLEFFHESKKRDIIIKLFVVAFHDTPIAAAIVLYYNGIAYYLHGASDYEHRALMAPYLLHWEILLHAQHDEYERYDLWGIDANRWPGVTRFKLGFGGRVIEYPGAFDIPIAQLRYWMYTIMQKLRR